MRRATLLVCAGLFVPAYGLTAARAQEPTQQLSALQAENKVLKATIEARDKKIAELQKQIEALRAEPGQKEVEALRQELSATKHRIAELEKQLKKAAPQRKDDPNKDRRMTLKDVAFLQAKELKSLPGGRVIGPTVVQRIEPDKGDKDNYSITLADTSGSARVPLGSGNLATAHWVQRRWVQVRCVAKMTEENALPLRVDDTLNIAGDVDKVDITPATNDTFEVILLYLKNVKAN